MNLRCLIGNSLLLMLLGCAEEQQIPTPAQTPHPSKTVQVTNSELDNSARRILIVRCSTCHSSASTGEGGFYSVLDVDAMVREGLIVPERSGDSPLLNRVVAGEMPTTGPLSEEEIETLRNWIDSLVFS